MKKKYLLPAVAALALLIAAGATIAYFNSNDSKTNAFTVGTVKVSVEEDSWDEDEEHKIEAGASFDKDPVVTNEGDVDEYVRMNVTIHRASDIRTALSDLPEPSPDSLFTAEEAGFDYDNWILSGEPKEDADEDTLTYTYNYQKPLAPGEKTTPIFKKVVFPEDLPVQYLKDVIGNDLFVISVSADAVQAEGFDNAGEAFEAFDGE